MILIAIVSIGTLIVAQAVFFPWRRDSLRFWTAVEYIWLAAAAMGLVFAAIEVNKLRIRDDVGEKEAAAERAWYEARQLVYGGDLRVWMADRNPGNAAAERVASWYRYIGNAVDNGYEGDGWLHFLNQNADLEFGPVVPGQAMIARIPQFPPVGWQRIELRDDEETLDHARRVLQKLRRLKIARDALHSARASLQPSSSERFFRTFAPWFLAVSWAFRVTKIRADGWRARGRQAPDTATPSTFSPADGGEGSQSGAL